MVGQRFIQLLDRHPWFEIAWLAASERSAGKTVCGGLPVEAGDAAAGADCGDDAACRMCRRMPVGELPRIIFAALDSEVAHELEPKFAAAGCAVISNSSAFRMTADVPLVVPEVNAEHLHLIDRELAGEMGGGRSIRVRGGYIVTNPNCCAIGLVLWLCAA